MCQEKEREEEEKKKTSLVNNFLVLELVQWRGVEDAEA